MTERWLAHCAGKPVVYVRAAQWYAAREKAMRVFRCEAGQVTLASAPLTLKEAGDAMRRVMKFVATGREQKNALFAAYIQTGGVPVIRGITGAAQHVDQTTEPGELDGVQGRDGARPAAQGVRRVRAPRRRR